MNITQCKRQHPVKKQRQAVKMAIFILVLFYICVIPYTLLRFVKYLKPSCAFQRSFPFIAVFMLFSSSVVNPIICLPFVESYCPGLRNIVCFCFGMRDNKRVETRTNNSNQGSILQKLSTNF